MNGYDIYKKAALRLGYNSATDTTAFDSKTLSRVLEIINQIALDLKLKTIETLSQKIVCSDEKLEALCCGTAMLLSLTEGDAEKNKIFTEIYNAKRSAVLNEISTIKDTLPYTVLGGE